VGKRYQPLLGCHSGEGEGSLALDWENQTVENLPPGAGGYASHTQEEREEARHLNYDISSDTPALDPTPVSRKERFFGVERD